ncbi:hypothetical protein [Streptomyces plumbiresistens]|uniref:Transposase n=1 Tax=Streptomyces plumbiresistens TaxID=511811 RepID=A0ABP7SDB9_9ACTN
MFVSSSAVNLRFVFQQSGERRPPRRGPHRTVLDHHPDEQRAFVIQQGARIRKGLRLAARTTTVFLAALREYAER